MLGLRWVEVWHSIRSVGEQTPFPSAIMKRHENQRSIEETNLYISIDISYASSWVFLLLLLRCLSTSAYDARNHTTSNEQTNLKPKKKELRYARKFNILFIPRLQLLQWWWKRCWRWSVSWAAASSLLAYFDVSCLPSFVRESWSSPTDNHDRALRKCTALDNSEYSNNCQANYFSN